ncbi:MAG: response regulator [Magnetococcus sp. WYHC-3]
MPPTLLLVEDSKSLSALLRGRIESRLPVGVVCAHTLAQARDCMARADEPFFVALLDLNLPDAPRGEVVAWARSHRLSSIVMTGYFDPDLRREWQHQGVVDYFVKDHTDAVDAVVQAVERMYFNRYRPVILVMPESDERQQLATVLRGYGFPVQELSQAGQVLRALEEQSARLVLTALRLQKMDGPELVRTLRHHNSGRKVTVVGLCPRDEPEQAPRFLKAGADDILLSPCPAEEVLCRIHQHIESRESRDHLGGLEQLHNAILENALDAIVTTDEQGVILEFNAAAEALFLCPRSSALGQSVTELLMPEPLREQHRQAMVRFMGDGLPVEKLQRRFEMPGQRRDGSPLNLDVALSVVSVEGLPRLTAVFRDIGAHKQLLATYRDTLHEAEVANAAKSSFIANISHEIRTPMNAVLGFTDLALKCDLPPRLQDYLDKIHSASHSLMGIINDILDFSRMESGQLDLDPVKFDLHQMLDRLADLFSQQVANKGLDLVFVVPSVCNHVLWGDAVRLEQILINLIRNAVKFTAQGSVVVRVLPIPEEDGQWMRMEFAVADTGMGIEPAQVERLFDPFVQADVSTTRRFGGTGLGLSICRSLVHLMGGDIRAESALNRGSTFTFHVRLGIHGPSRRRRLALPEEHQGRRVLLLEDNPDAGEQMLTLLESVGCRPALTTRIPGAVEHLLSAIRDGDPCHTVLVDWSLPERDGVAAVVEMRATLAAVHPRTPAPVFLLLTPFGIEEIRHNALRAGIQGFLDKPVTRSRLVRALLGSVAAAQSRERRGDRVLGLEGETARRIAGARVLVIEDRPVNRQIVRELLERVGVVVDMASGGREGLEASARNTYDLILLDLHMPDVSGLDVVRDIRGREGAPPPLVAMTSHVVPAEKRQCQEEGLGDYLEKPLRPERLYGCLARLIAPSHPTDDSAFLPDAAHPRTLAGLDQLGAMERLGDNHALWQQLLTRLVRDFGDAPERVHRNLVDGNIDAARRVMHDLYGLARLTGAVRVAADCEHFRSRGEQPDVETLDSLGTHLEELRTILGVGRDAALTPWPAPMGKVVLEGEQRALLAPIFAGMGRALLAHMLDQEGRIGAVEDILGAQAAALPLERLRQSIRAYEFPEALALLTRMAESLGMSLELETTPPGDAWSETILIIEDQRDNADLLREILADRPRQVALDGEQGLRLARSLPTPGLILLDVMMPGLNGYEVCRRLKEDPVAREIPVIFVTARKEVEDESEGFAAGGVDFITKPFNAGIIRHRVANHLELRRHRHELERLVRQRTLELEEARLQAERRKESAEAGNRAKSRFLATMSHEIRTPMNAILGMAEALEDTPLEEEQQRFVQVFKRAGQGLLVLIDDLLDLNRVESGRLELNRTPFELRSLLAETLQLVETQGRSKGLSMELAASDDLPRWVEGDGYRLRQVLINLLGNAVKFTHRGGVTLRVERVAGHSHRLLFTVEDSGIGIPLDRQEEIFHGFVQGDARITRDYGGSGLGLAISRRLVVMMGGDLRVNSAPHQGSRFFFDIALPETLISTAHKNFPGGGWERALGGPALRILLVEDAPDNVLLVQTFLKKTPHRITQVWNGEEAMAALQGKSFDLVLMDLQMPRMDGLTATRLYRELEQQTGRRRTPIVALTAHALAENAEEALEAGCDNVLTKPVSRQRLLEMIARYM